MAHDSLNGRTLVAVVDDDPSIRRALTRLLGSADLEVRAFESAGAFLSSDWPALPTCLVLDFHLPDMNGLALLHRVAEEQPHLPVVMISGDKNPELRKRALRQGAAAFLTKPLDDGKLLDEVFRALGIGESLNPSPCVRP